MPKTITFTHLWDSLIFTPFSKTVHQHTPLTRWTSFWIARHWFYASMLLLTRWTFFISKPDKVHHRSTVATNRTCWDKPVCTDNTLWHQHYITTSKEYL